MEPLFFMHAWWESAWRDTLGVPSFPEGREGGVSYAASKGRDDFFGELRIQLLRMCMRLVLLYIRLNIKKILLKIKN